MALTNDFKVKNGLTVIDSISAGGNLSASEGFFDSDVGIGTNSPSGELHVSNTSDFFTDLDGDDSAIIFKEAGGNPWRIGNKSSDDSFRITQDVGSLNTNPRFTIANGGNVGIGTTSPSERLHIHNSTGNGATIRLSDPDSTSTANATGYVEVYHGENTSRAGYFGLITNSEMALATTTSAGNIKLYTGNNTVALTIDSSQRVGIGTTAPGQKLTVGGSLSAHRITESDSLCNVKIGTDTLKNNTTGDHNVAIGSSALCVNTEGDCNTAIGKEVLRFNTTGVSNVAIGPFALYCNTEGGYNTALGDRALLSNTTGCHNTAVGRNSLLSNTTGNFNTSIGFTTLQNNTTGSCNVAIGEYALHLGLSGCHNVAVGQHALCSSYGGTLNVAIGKESLRSNTTGSCNVAIGNNTLRKNTTGSWQTAVGLCALCNNTTGYGNAAFGNLALCGNTTGVDNVGVGYLALGDNVSGSCNVAVGYQSLKQSVSGTHNFASGACALFSNWGGSCNTSIGYLSLQCNTTGTANAAVGAQSLRSNTTGSNNVALGPISLFKNTTGGDNIALGCNALYGNTTGGCNFAAGVYSLAANLSACYNTAIGQYAMLANYGGCHNTAIGQNALKSNTEGDYNTAIGQYALCAVTSGDSNIGIGLFALCNANGSQNIAIGQSAGIESSGGSDVTSATNSIAIGCSTKFGDTTPTNEIVIGSAAIGNGDNTTTIGNSSTTNAYICGDVNTSSKFISGGQDLADIFITSAQAGDITAVTTGPYLTGGGASGSVEVGIDSACAAAWDAAVAGDISAVIAGTGLTGGGTSGSVTLNLSAGDGVQATANCVSVDSTVVRTTGNQTIAGTKNFSGKICVGTDIEHTGNPSTCFGFDSNQIRAHAAGGEEIFRVNATGMVVNEGGQPNDFRVEGDTDTHALFVDGSKDNVGIGTSSTENNSKLTVATSDTTALSTLLRVGSTSANQDYTALRFGNTTSTQYGDYGFSLNYEGTQAGNNNRFVWYADNQTGSGGQCIGMSMLQDGKVGIGKTTPGYQLDVAGDIGLDGTLRHNGDADTYITFGSNTIGLYAGGEDAINIDASSTTFNQGGIDRDFRVEGDTDVYALFVEGSTDRVGIGTASPSAKLTVAGNLSAQNCIIGEQIVKRGGTSSQFLKADGSVDSTSYGTGDITAVTAGTGLTGGGTSGSVTLNLSAGDGVQATANCVSVDSTVARTTGDTFTGNIILNDNVELRLGTSSDFKAFHNGTNTCLQNFTGDLNIQNDADDGDIVFKSDNGSGGTGTYFRVDGGSTNVQFFKDVFLTDNTYLNIGGDFDLRLFHDTNNSYIQSQGTGHLIIQQTVDDKDIIFKSDDGSGGVTPYLTLDGSAGYTTVQKQMRFGDGVFLQIGDSADLSIYHQSGNNIIASETGPFILRQNLDDGDIIFQSDNGSGGVTEYFKLDGSYADGTYTYTSWGDGDVVTLGDSRDLRLWHDPNVNASYIRNYTNNLNIENNATDKDIIFSADNGAGSVTPYFKLDGASERLEHFKNDLHYDNVRAQFGDSADLQIYHDGSNSYIADTSGTGSLIVDTNAFLLKSANNGEFMMTAYQDGAVNLMHNNATKFSTTASGITVCGDSLVTGNSTIYGNLSVTGDFTCLETTVSTTSALSVTNTGTGPALFVCQAGVQPIAHFIDANGDDIVFADDGKVGIGTFNPAEELTVSGTISASEFVYVGEKKAVSSDDINFIVKVTQAEYDALTPDSGTLYVITDESTNSPVVNPIATVTANYTVTDEDHTILTNGSSVLNVGLPSAATNSNYVYNIKNISTNGITISAAAGNIDGQSSRAICQQFENVTVQSDGSNWFVI